MVATDATADHPPVGAPLAPLPEPASSRTPLFGLHRKRASGLFLYHSGLSLWQRHQPTSERREWIRQRARAASGVVAGRSSLAPGSQSTLWTPSPKMAPERRWPARSFHSLKPAIGTSFRRRRPDRLQGSRERHRGVAGKGARREEHVAQAHASARAHAHVRGVGRKRPRHQGFGRR